MNVNICLGKIEKTYNFIYKTNLEIFTCFKIYFFVNKVFILIDKCFVFLIFNVYKEIQFVVCLNL